MRYMESFSYISLVLLYLFVTRAAVLWVWWGSGYLDDNEWHCTFRFNDQKSWYGIFLRWLCQQIYINWGDLMYDVIALLLDCWNYCWCVETLCYRNTDSIIRQELIFFITAFHLPQSIWTFSNLLAWIVITIACTSLTAHVFSTSPSKLALLSKKTTWVMSQSISTVNLKAVSSFFSIKPPELLCRSSLVGNYHEPSPFFT